MCTRMLCNVLTPRKIHLPFAPDLGNVNSRQVPAALHNWKSSVACDVNIHLDCLRGCWYLSPVCRWPCDEICLVHLCSHCHDDRRILKLEVPDVKAMQGLCPLQRQHVGHWKPGDLTAPIVQLTAPSVHRIGYQWISEEMAVPQDLTRQCQFRQLRFGLPWITCPAGCSTHTESRWTGNIALDVLKKTAVSSGLDLYSSHFFTAKKDQAAT